MYGVREVISDLNLSADEYASPHHKTFMPDLSKSINI